MPEQSTAANIAFIEQSIADFFRSKDEMCPLKPVGSAERTHNLQAVADSQIQCEQARRETPLPKIEVGKLDEISGAVTLTMTGAHGSVLVHVTDSPLARYVKKSGEEIIRGEAVVESPMLWARLARWASSGKKKFVS